MSVVVGPEPIDIAAEHTVLAGLPNAGAVVLFTGHVREEGERGRLQAMELEHYPGMTESAIREIIEEATRRWPLLSVRVRHRTGMLFPRECIVSVAVAALHRDAAFSAAEFMMDYLKARAPFWKKEIVDAAGHWIDAKTSDGELASRW